MNDSDQDPRWEEALRFSRVSQRKDVQGILPFDVAAQLLSISEQEVMAAIQDQRLRRFEFPLLGLTGVAAKDLRRMKNERI